MSSETTPTRRPIAALRISTVALLGIVAAVAVPAGATALVLSGSVDSQHKQQQLSQSGPVTKVVVVDTDSSVHITGNAALSGMTGHADLTWHSFGGKDDNVQVTQQYADGVLTLTKDCGGNCGADIDIQVPPTVSVQVTTSNGGINVSDVSGTVDLRSSNASISASRLGGGDATMNTSNASIHASFVGAPKNIWAHTSNASVFIATDDHTLYYDKVVTTNGTPITSNPQDHRSDNVIDVLTSNAGVTIK